MNIKRKRFGGLAGLGAVVIAAYAVYSLAAVLNEDVSLAQRNNIWVPDEHGDIARAMGQQTADCGA